MIHIDAIYYAFIHPNYSSDGSFKNIKFITRTFSILGKVHEGRMMERYLWRNCELNTDHRDIADTMKFVTNHQI